MNKKTYNGLFYTLKGYSLSYLPKDIFSGIIIAAVSIPISMGYAEVSGLPPVYGLYGSLLPILFYAAFTKSRQFIFGVDATPAALTGATLASLGIAAGSREAMAFVPVMALFTGLWLLLFYFLKAGKIVDFISTPVMGGFISGIGIEIILMQIPKILGGKAHYGRSSGTVASHSGNSAGNQLGVLCTWNHQLCDHHGLNKTDSQVSHAHCDHAAGCRDLCLFPIRKI